MKEDEIIKKLILKMISNKINNNKKNIETKYNRLKKN
jgi:hypothetical protein